MLDKYAASDVEVQKMIARGDVEGVLSVLYNNIQEILEKKSKEQAIILARHDAQLKRSEDILIQSAKLRNEAYDI